MVTCFICLKFATQTVRKRFIDETRTKNTFRGNVNNYVEEDFIQINPKLSATLSLGLNLLELIQHTDVMMSLMMENCSPFL